MLAKPLGISLARWSRDPQGIYLGGNEMLMTPRQMIALGELYLNKGRARGRQVLQSDWVEPSLLISIGLARRSRLDPGAKAGSLAECKGDEVQTLLLSGERGRQRDEYGTDSMRCQADSP